MQQATSELKAANPDEKLSAKKLLCGFLQASPYLVGLCDWFSQLL